MSYAETDTAASRVVYINSGDATIKYNNRSSDFDFDLQEPIIVPPHHSMLLSVYSAEIPYSFYNFETGRNTRIDFQLTPYGQPASYDANGKFDVDPAGFNSRTFFIPEGNYTAQELAATLSAGITTFIAGPGVVFPLTMTFNPTKQKFEFICNLKGYRITLGLANGVQSGLDGNDVNEELGFDLTNIQGDPFSQVNGALTAWNTGYTQPPLAPPGNGIDVGVINSADPLTLLGDDVVDMVNSIRSLFVRTNLSSTSVMDSHIGGGFSNILCRVPLRNTLPGQVIGIDPVNGDIHKLLIKTKAITTISIKLTNQRNTIIDLNGLDWDICLKVEFIETVDFKGGDIRRIVEDEQVALAAKTQTTPNLEPLKKPEELKGKKKKKEKKKKISS